MPSSQQCAQCEATLPASAHFCPECGTRLPGTPEPPPLPEPAPRWRGRKVVIWLVVICVLVGGTFMLGVTYFVQHTMIVTTNKSGGRAETPYGTLSSTKDPQKLAHSLGLQVYPGAIGVQGTEAQLPHGVIVSIEFSSTAPPADIIHYYHIRYPDASVHGETNGRTLVQLNPRGTMTIEAERTGPSKTRILVSDIRH